MVGAAVVLVGGLGTRLGALTRSDPKPLLPVGERPFLLRLTAELQRHGIEKILLLAGFQAEKVAALAADSIPGARVIVEPEPLGTGGALRFALDLLPEQFFLLNGDSLFDVNLWDLATLAGKEVDGVLSLRAVPDAARYGAARLEGERITGFEHRPEQPEPGLINGGVSVLTRAAIDRIPAGHPVSLEREIYPLLAAEGRLRGRVYERPFIDIGVPEDYARAQSYIPELTRRGAVIFDRDGVLNVDVNYAHRPDQIVWMDGAMEAVKAVNDAGLFAFVATNQAGVARGFYPEEQVPVLHAWMNAELRTRGAHIDAFEHSPFHPDGTVERYRREADCRKPGPAMITRLLDRFGADRARTVMIGDRPSDVAAAEAAGVEGMLFAGGSLMDQLGPVIARLAEGAR